MSSEDYVENFIEAMLRRYGKRASHITVSTVDDYGLVGVDTVMVLVDSVDKCDDGYPLTQCGEAYVFRTGCDLEALFLLRRVCVTFYGFFGGMSKDE